MSRRWMPVLIVFGSGCWALSQSDRLLAAADDEVSAAVVAPLSAAPAVQGSTTPATSSSTSAPNAAAPPSVASPLAGHSLHGEVFNEGPRQHAYLMRGMPTIDFPITTRSPDAQSFFNQGIGQLHGFWYFEAERSFREAAYLDPDCAIAYWGMAMANFGNEKRGQGFIDKAHERKANASPREQAWIAAAHDYLHAKDDNTERRRRYIRALEAIVQDYPQDVEAKAFLVLQIWTSGGWMTEGAKQLPISSHQAVDALLDQVFAASPMHPAHHFRIHLWDQEKRERALGSAALCGQTSPGIAHMWHMPGHIYSGMNRYADAVWQQEASARVDHAHMMRDRILPDQIHNYAHNNEWLIRNWLALGRARDAITLAKNMLELPRHPKHNQLDRGGSSANYGRARLLEALDQFELWPELIEVAATNYYEPLPATDERIKRSRLLGTAYFALGQRERGLNEIAALESLLGDERAARYRAADEAEAKARADKKSEDDIAKAMAEALKAASGTLKRIERGIAELKVRDAIARNDLSVAKAEFEKIKGEVELRREQIARLHLQLGDLEQAERVARDAVAPNEVSGLATLVEVLHRAGKTNDAGVEFEKLRAVAGYADLDAPALRRLAELARQLNLPDDWRQPKPSSDVGVRPPLDTLGPLRWQPTAAPGWSIVGAHDEIRSLEQYRGKPVVLIFYLGSGCLHCVEQLKKFSPRTAEFAAEGVSILAISSEPIDSLKQSLTALSEKEQLQFPLACDAGRDVFRSYRAFDDFENLPLHGTFLIDGEGLIRWQDISYEPFDDPSFVLGEARRLFGKRQ